jgi:hypothetical protein
LSLFLLAYYSKVVCLSSWQYMVFRWCIHCRNIVFLLEEYRNPASVVVIVTRLRAGGLVVSIPQEAWDLLPSPNRLDQLWKKPSLLFNAYRTYFLGIKPPGRDVDHCPQFSAEATNGAILLLPPHVFMARTVAILLCFADTAIQHRVFTFLPYHIQPYVLNCFSSIRASLATFQILVASQTIWLVEHQKFWEPVQPDRGGQTCRGGEGVGGKRVADMHSSDL